MAAASASLNHWVMGWRCLLPLLRPDVGTTEEAEAVAPPSFWDDPAPSCPSSQAPAGATAGHLPSTPQSTLPFQRTPVLSCSLTQANQQGGLLHEDSLLLPQLLSWRGTGSLLRVTRNHCPKCPCVHVTRSALGHSEVGCSAIFGKNESSAKGTSPFFAVQSHQRLSSQHFLFPDHSLSTSLAVRLPRLS